MSGKNVVILGIALMLVCVTQAGRVEAEFIVVDNFDGLVPGPIDDQNGWRAQHSTSEVTADPEDGSNLVLSVITDSTYLFREAIIPDGTVRMLFLRFRYADQLNFSLGTSGSQFPTQFGDFEVELSMTNASSELRINDDGNYDTIAIMQPDVWYNCWLSIDNADEVTAVWLHDRAGEAATPADRLDAEGQELFTFRSGSANDLRTFFIKTGGGSGVSGPLYVDDIYLEDTDALNLTNPAAQPTPAADLPAWSGLRSVDPNPFNPRTSIKFAMPGTGTATVAIYGITGERVAVLANRTFAPGEHVVVWDGRDTAGLAVASGPYLVRLETSERTESRKIMLVR
jgi:hypothetical protein